jgi:hypothetical protein
VCRVTALGERRPFDAVQDIILQGADDNGPELRPYPCRLVLVRPRETPPTFGANPIPLAGACHSAGLVRGGTTQVAQAWLVEVERASST